ncbi:hypothetical protein ACJJTC_004694 [Scirpophaga incertulas]
MLRNHRKSATTDRRDLVPAALAGLAARPSVLAVLNACWSERPDRRPDLRLVRLRLKDMHAGMKTNIFDNMLSMMEKYASNLEALVAARTEQLLQEKSRTDDLLNRMLPRGPRHPGASTPDPGGDLGRKGKGQTLGTPHHPGGKGRGPQVATLTWAPKAKNETPPPRAYIPGKFGIPGVPLKKIRTTIRRQRPKALGSNSSPKANTSKEEAPTSPPWKADQKLPNQPKPKKRPRKKPPEHQTKPN